MAKKSGANKKGKKPHKNNKTSRKYARYSIEGDKIRRTPHCPRCGPGIFLAVGDGRSRCGKCSYTEFAEKATA